MSLHRIALAAVALVVATTTSGPCIALAGTAGAALEQALRALVAAEGGPPGAIAIVNRDGRPLAFGAGVADLATGAPIEPDLAMRLASVSKAYDGAVALALVDRGALSLEDTIGGRLPDLPADWAAVTLRQLLNHTSGLPDYLLSAALLARLAADPTETIPPDELLPYAYGEPLRFPPGTRYAYSNSDNVAAALMVEAATGRSYEEELAERVLAPLRLTATSLPDDVLLPAPFLHGYEVLPGEEPVDLSEALSPSAAWAAGAMVSTPVELDRFLRGLLGRRLFGKATQAEQLEPIDGGSSEPPGPGRNSAGLGIFRYEARCGTVYGHTGNFIGYTQFAAATRDGRRSATVSISSQLRPDIDPELFARLREIFELAVCAALEPSRPVRLPALLRRGSG